jgi:parvulin-like peptidyl-prolyl isomerase
MTFRARPVVRRRGRAGWESGDRRNTLINAGFVAAIVISILILVGYAGFSWYQDHFGAAATVDGQVITLDDLSTRISIEQFRLDYIERRIQTLMAKGRITPTDGAQQLDFLNQRRQQLDTLTLDRLVDVTLMAKLADDNGITVEESDIDEQLRKEATTSPERHVWMIELEPEANADTGQVGSEEKAAAKKKADQALADLKSGTSWEDVAKTVSTSPNGAQDGDLGWLAEDSGYDEAFMKAVFATELNQPTAVIGGDDDVYRIGRATEEAAEEVDSTYEEQIADEGIKLEDYRRAVRGDVTRTKLSDKIVADLSKPGPQRHVEEIYLPEPVQPEVGLEPGVKVRRILYAPNDDPLAAQTLPAEDPAWGAAKDEADADYATLKADLKRFDAMARAVSDDATAKADGGKQPWSYPSSKIDEAFKNAIFDPNLKPGDLIAPVRSNTGWLVIQFLRPIGDGEGAWLESLKAQAGTGTSFEQLAKDNSEGEEAKDGGDLGWIAPGQLDGQVDAAVLETAIGSISDVIAISGDGYYLLKILAEETRTPTEEQLKIIKQTGFSYWYTRQKETADISYDYGTSAGVA